MGPEDVSLHIPGTALVMRLHPGGFVDPSALDHAPILVGPAPHGHTRPVVTFDATILSEAFGPRWPAVEALLSSIEPAQIAPELARLVHTGQLPAECAPILAFAEAAFVEGDPHAALALVLVYLHARITAVAT